MKQDFRQTFRNVLKFFVIMLAMPCVSSIFESMCFGTGYVDVGTDQTKPVGPRDTGWNRLFPVNERWTHSFWSVRARQDSTSFNVQEYLLKEESAPPNTYLNGWLALEIERKTAFHYLAVWAVTQSNEVYGNFIFDKDFDYRPCRNGGSDPFQGAYAYFPCSAAPVNSATVPNTFVYANLAMKRDPKSGNFESAAVQQNSVGQQEHITLIWRAPAQTYCQRPEQFMFIIVLSDINPWETDWNKHWSVAQPEATMEDQGYSGPLVAQTQWFHPKFFGLPSRFSTLKTLRCAGFAAGSTWIQKTSSSTPAYTWFSDQLWSTNNADWNDVNVKARSTCKAHSPQSDIEDGFGGRCTDEVKGTNYVEGSQVAAFKCTDSRSQFGQHEFDIFSSGYEVQLQQRMEGDCDCTVVSNNPVTARSLPRSLPVFSSVLQMRTVSNSNVTESGVERNEACSPLSKIKSKLEQDKAGICIHSKVGTLVYGLRQWHGVTSLCVALIITPLSMFIARYNKGEMVLIEGKVPLKGWYISHILLVFPAIWMYASGLATMSRQKDVLGQSYSKAARFHRNLGMATFLFIPFQFMTGFLRPTNIPIRKFLIFIHWAGGIAQHILELILCILSSQIPGSPTSSKSLVHPNFGSLSSSIVGCLIIGWFAFTIIFHIFLLIRLKRKDILDGVSARSLFPIIVPLFSTAARDDIDIGYVNKDIWFERGALLIFSLVSSIVFAISIVSLYQALYDNLYYGFGPMSCTHTLKGFLINSSRRESGCE